jgi:hypothetical protein
VKSVLSAVRAALPLAKVLTISAIGFAVASWLERHPCALEWRLNRNLLNTPYAEIPSAKFSELQPILDEGEKPFERPDLERDLVRTMKTCHGVREILIVGGAGGIGKSVFWENFLSTRPLTPADNKVVAAASPSAHATSAAAWTGLEGPTRVIDLLKCEDLSAFRETVISVFHPTPFLPNICLLPEPTFKSTLELLEKVLPSLSAKGVTLLVYLEDVNRIHTYSSPKADDASGPDNTIITFFNTLSRGGALVVGNSSVVLSYAKFEKYSHTGMRTQRFFFPALSSDDPQLVLFAESGGRLWDFTKVRPPSSSSISVVDKIDVWNGNVIMLRKAAISADGPFLLKIKDRVSKSLCSLAMDRKHSDLVDTDCEENKTRVLALRRELLQLLLDNNGKVRVSSLPAETTRFRVHEQLAALDLVSFRTEYDPVDQMDVDYVVPYHPVVLKIFSEKMAERKAWFQWW